MEIIELNELQFKNYSNIHSKKNYKQSIEYANLEEKNGYNKLFLGLVDDNQNVIAATLLLEKKLSGKYKYGYCPNGFLIDFFNTSLVNIFTVELKKYLKQYNFIYIRLNPKIEYQIFSSSFILVENNSNVINELKKLGYQFINNTSKYHIVLNSTDINKTYSNFKRSLRRNIKSSLEQGITVHRCNYEDKDIFLSFVKDKAYFQNVIDLFQSSLNEVEIYYAKMNPEIYINNYRYLLKMETNNNDVINRKLQSRNVKKTNKLLNKKMISDKLIIKYNNEIIRGTDIYSKYPEGVIISACLIINNKKEIDFIGEGFNEEFKNYKSMPILKWEIMKKYINLGYSKFDLGEVEKSISNNYSTNQGFNGNIVECSNDFDLVINEMLYKLNNSINAITKGGKK